jgi:hypothetical protein
MGQVAGGAGQFLTGLIPIASTVLSVATLAAAIYFTADMGQP